MAATAHRSNQAERQTHRQRAMRAATATLPLMLPLLLLLLLLTVAAPQLVHAIPFTISDVTIQTSLNVGSAVDSVSMSKVTITNGAALKLDVSAMLPGRINIQMTDCVCSGGSQIYILGYGGDAVPPSTRALSVSISGMKATSCSLVFAYAMPTGTNVTITNSSLATTSTIGYSTVMGSDMDAIAAPLALYAVSLSGGGSVRVVNTTLATTASGGMAVYVGGTTSFSGSALVLDSVQLSASLGPSAYAMYAPTLSLADGSVLSVTASNIASASYGLYFGTGLSVSGSVVRVIQCIGALPSPVVQAGGSVTNGGWMLLSWVRAAQTKSKVADLSGLTLDGGDVSMVRCLASGSTLGSGATLTSGNIYAQCNRAAGVTLTTAGAYNTAGISNVIVKQCDACAQETSCYSALTSSVATDSGCECVCSAGGVGAQCLPMAAPTPDTSSSTGGTYCVRDTTVTSALSLGSGLATVCFERVVFSGQVKVEVDLSAMDAFADTLNVSLTNCTMEGGAMLKIQGSPDVEMIPPSWISIVNMTATDGTIAFVDGVAARSTVVVENSTLFSTSTNSQYVPMTSGFSNQRYAPTLAFVGVKLVETQFVVTRTTMGCSGTSTFDCIVTVMERGLTVDQQSSFYMDNNEFQCPKQCMRFLTGALLVNDRSVVALQNSTWTVVSGSDTAITVSGIAVQNTSAMKITDNLIRTPYTFLFSDSDVTALTNSWMEVSGNSLTVYNCLRFSTGMYISKSSVFSAFNNALSYGSFSSSVSFLLYVSGSDSGGTLDSTSSIYGGCNTLATTLLTQTEYKKIGLGAFSQVFGCDICTQSASCFNAQTASISGCTCSCSSNGYGKLCLPAPVPTMIGTDKVDAPASKELPCIRGETLSAVVLSSSSSGACYVDVTFAATISLDIAALDPTATHYNVTLLRCTFSNQLNVQGSTTAPLYLNITAATFGTGYPSLNNAFADGSELYFVDSTVSGSMTYFVYLNSQFYLGSGSKLLVFRSTYTPTSKTSFGVYAPGTLTLLNSSYIVDSCTIAISATQLTYSAVRNVAINMSAGSVLALTRNTALSAVFLYVDDWNEITNSMLIMYDNVYTFSGSSTSGTFLYWRRAVTLSDGAQVRASNNSVKGARLLLLLANRNLEFASGSSSMIITGNTITDFTTTGGIAWALSQITVSGTATIVVGCNTQGGKSLTYANLPTASTTTISCTDCNENAQCYAPGTASFVSSPCSCTCKNSSYHGDHCYPYEEPNIAPPAIPGIQVDQSTTCVSGGTMTDMSSLNLWKTNHCYVGVTFSGAAASVTFDFSLMPLTYAINITFANCTFSNSALLAFTTDAQNPAASSGILITVKQVILNNGVVCFMYGLPMQSTVSITDISGTQTSTVSIKIGSISYSNYYSSVYLYSFIMSDSTILISNAVSSTTSTSSSTYFMFIRNGSPLITNHSALVIRYNTISGYSRLMHVLVAITVSSNSVFNIHNNTLTGGGNYFVQFYVNAILQSGSVLRFYGNVAETLSGGGLVTYQDLSLSGGSWVEISGNRFPQTTLLQYLSSNYGANIDGTSSLTMVNNVAAAFTRSGFSMFDTLSTGYKFIVGCMTINGVDITTAAELATLDVTEQTEVAACGACTVNTNCYAPLTTSITASTCTCVCATGGYGAQCLPVASPIGPPPPPAPTPPPPPPGLPAVGECISDMTYPVTKQTFGSNATWLCYRNVTFSGSGLILEIDVATLGSGVVNITFDSCTWSDGALLDIVGGTNAGITALNILITNDKRTSSGISLRNTFPPKTNITVVDSSFTATSAFPQGGLSYSVAYWFASFGGLTLIDSVFVVMGCSFGGTYRGYLYDAFHPGTNLTSGSLFAFINNEVTQPLTSFAYFRTNSGTVSLGMYGNSSFVVRQNRVTTGGATYFLNVYNTFEAFNGSVLLVENNAVSAQYILYYRDISTMYSESYVSVSSNTFYATQTSAAILYAYYGIVGPSSTVSLTNNIVSYETDSTTTGGIVTIGSYTSLETPAKKIVKCNTFNGAPATYPSIPTSEDVEERTCESVCALEEECVPAYTESFLTSSCTCTCLPTAYGSECTPQPIPSTGSGDECVQSAVITADFTSTDRLFLCYQRTTFKANMYITFELQSQKPVNISVTNSSFTNPGSLYIHGKPIRSRVLVQLASITFYDKSGLVLSGTFPSGSSIVVVDCVLQHSNAPTFSSTYNTWPLTTSLLLYNVTLTNSVMTVARTNITAMYEDAVAMLIYDGLSLTGNSALYLDGMAVETVASTCVSATNGDVSVGSGSVLSLTGSTFLLCTQALSIASALTVSGASAMTVSANTFASAIDYAVSVSGSSMDVSGGSTLLVKDNVCSGQKELLRLQPVLRLSGGSTLSFAGNRVSFSRLVSLSVSMSDSLHLSAAAGTSHLRVGCNTAGNTNVTTANQYGSAGFGDTSLLDITQCGTCGAETYCVASGASSASSDGSGTCVCACSSSSSGNSCEPVAASALPAAPAQPVQPSFTVSDTTVSSPIVVPNKATNITFAHLVVKGVQLRVYVPWMGDGPLRVIVQDMTLQSGSALNILGSGGSASTTQSLQLSVCGLTSVSGALVFSGAFPVNSAITVSDSVFVMLEPSSLPYLGASTASDYSPAIVLSGVTLTQGVLIVYDVQVLCVMGSGRAVVGDGSGVTLVSSGIALDSSVFGAAYAVYLPSVSTLRNGSVLRVSESKMYGGYGVMLSRGVKATDSVVAVNGNTGALSAGPLLTVATTAEFTGSWLSVRDASCTGGQAVVALPTGTTGLVAAGGTFSLYGVSGDGSTLLTGAVNIGSNIKYIAGCLKMNGVELLAYEYSTKAGVRGTTKTLPCNVCDTTVTCYAPLTKSMEGCKCICAIGGYGASCLPVYMPAVDGCNILRNPPDITDTMTLTQTLTDSATLYPTASTPTLSLSRTYYSYSTTETITPPIPPTPTPTFYSTPTPTVPPTGTVTITPEPTDTLTVTRSISVEVEEGERTTACPALAVSISGTGTSGKLSQADIRDAGNAMPMVVSVALPDGYQWASRDNLGQYFSYVLMSSKQANGFAGEWGALVAAMQWTRSTEHPLTMLQSTVPRYANYLIGVNEEVDIAVNPTAVYGGCQGLLRGTMKVEAGTTQSLRSAMYVVNTVVSTVAAAVALLTGGLGSLAEIQVLGVFATMPCASAFEKETAGALPYFLSFFAGLEYLWMTVGNLCITIVFAAVHFGVAAIVRRYRSVDWENAFAMVLFPSLSYLVAYLMFLGVFVPSVMMLAMSTAKAEHYVVGVIGVVYALAFFRTVYYLLSEQSALEFTKYWQFSKKPFYSRWLFPIGYWGPEPRRMMYNSMVTSVKGRYMYYGTFPLAVLCVVGIIASLEVRSSRCHILYFCMMAVLLVAAAVVAVTNLMRSAFLTIAQTVLFVLLAVLCLINAINYMSPSQSGQNAYSAFQIIVMILLLFVAIYSFVIGFLEMKYWQTMREPKRGDLEELLNTVDNADAEDDIEFGDEDAKSVAETELEKQTRFSSVGTGFQDYTSRGSVKKSSDGSEEKSEVRSIGSALDLLQEMEGEGSDEESNGEYESRESKSQRGGAETSSYRSNEDDDNVGEREERGTRDGDDASRML